MLAETGSARGAASRAGSGEREPPRFTSLPTEGDLNADSCASSALGSSSPSTIASAVLPVCSSTSGGGTLAPSRIATPLRGVSASFAARSVVSSSPRRDLCRLLLRRCWRCWELLRWPLDPCRRCRRCVRDDRFVVASTPSLRWACRSFPRRVGSWTTGMIASALEST